MERGDRTLLIVFALALILIGLAAGYFILQKYPVVEQVKNNEIDTKNKTLTNNTSEWKKYTSDNNYFSVDWPPGWDIEIDGESGIMLRGKEGSFNIAWNGLGGACDEDKIKQFTEGEDSYWICEFDADGLYRSATISKTSDSDIGIGIIPSYTGTTSSDKTLFLKVLNSIKLHSLAKITEWKTYRNNEFGFEMEYPGSWSVVDVSKIPSNVGIYPTTDGIRGNIYFSKPSFGWSVNMIVVDNPSRLSAKSFVENMIKKDPNFYQQPVGYKTAYEVNINGIPAYELYGVFGGDSFMEKVYIAQEDNIFVIDFPIAEPNSNFSVDPVEYNKISHKILSTFKFTK